MSDERNEKPDASPAQTGPTGTDPTGTAPTETGGVARMGADKVVAAYARWAPVYDGTFGRITAAARRAAAERVNALPDARVLEVGVGTGIALATYRAGHRVTGIDLSADMLAKARAKVKREDLRGVEAIHEMDAQAMTFADASFDVAVAMFVITVVPDPQAVLDELARVVRPGGTVLFINHFSREPDDRTALARLERAAAPLGETLGWRPVFPVETVTRHPLLKPRSEERLAPGGLFTMLEMDRAA